MSSILIVAPEGDLHALVVAERLRARGCSCLIWNTSWHPWKSTVHWSLEDAGFTSGARTFALSAFDAVWWRRYNAPTVSPLIADEAVRRFCRGEAAEALRGLFFSHPRVINDIGREQLASAKIDQLRVASQLGIAVPRTLVSNDPARIRAFAAGVGPCICKTLYCDYPHGVPTRVLTEADLADAAALAMAPIIVQAQVSCRKDIRVSVIGDQVFAGELVRENADVEVDWRKDPRGWRPHPLPTGLAQRLVRLLRHYGLEMGAIDLRIDRQGDYQFFEINPSGQFLFLEIDAGLPVSAAVAGLLAGAAEARRGSVQRARRRRPGAGIGRVASTVGPIA